MSIQLKNYNLPQTKSTASTEAKEKPTSDFWTFMNRDIQLFGGGLSLKTKERMYSQLQILLEAGLDIQRALELVEESQKKKKHKEIINTIKESIISGDSFSEAIRKSEKFSTYEVFSIQIGEESGQLIAVLKELGIFFEKSMKYRRQLIGALSYPVFVTVFALSVVYFLLSYLVPMFSSMFGRFGKDLPQLTQTIVYLSDWLRANAKYLFLGIAVITGTLYSQRTKLWFRRLSSAFAIRLPVFGKIIKLIYLARFSQSTSLLLRSKVPLLKTVELVRKMIEFYPIEKSLEQAEDDILKGSFFHDTLQQFSFYPHQLIALIKVGEESGKLDDMFQKLAKQYNNEVDQQTAIIGSLLEPILIIGLGLLVGVILVAMYLPLFQMSMTVG